MTAQPESASPPRNRRFRLATVRGCRRELAAVYAEARQDRLDWQSARAASVLQILTRMIEGDAFEARIIALEQAAAGEHGHRATNGRGYHDAHP